VGGWVKLDTPKFVAVISCSGEDGWGGWVYFYVFSAIDVGSRSGEYGSAVVIAELADG
jgi:hypothetical protein